MKTVNLNNSLIVVREIGNINGQRTDSKACFSIATALKVGENKFYYLPFRINDDDNDLNVSSRVFGNISLRQLNTQTCYEIMNKINCIVEDLHIYATELQNRANIDGKYDYKSFAGRHLTGIDVPYLHDFDTKKLHKNNGLKSLVGNGDMSVFFQCKKSFKAKMRRKHSVYLTTDNDELINKITMENIEENSFSSNRGERQDLGKAIYLDGVLIHNSLTSLAHIDIDDHIDLADLSAILDLSNNPISGIQF